jgi:hypothetical protein
MPHDDFLRRVQAARAEARHVRLMTLLTVVGWFILFLGIVAASVIAYERGRVKSQQRTERRERRALKRARKAARKAAKSGKTLPSTPAPASIPEPRQSKTFPLTPAHEEGATWVYGIPEASSSSEALLFGEDDTELGLHISDLGSSEYISL